MIRMHRRIARCGAGGLGVVAMGLAVAWGGSVLGAMIRPTPEELARAMTRNEAAIRAWPGAATAPAAELPASGGGVMAIVVAMPSASDEDLAHFSRAVSEAARLVRAGNTLVLVEGERIMGPEAGSAPLDGRAEIGTAVSTALAFLTREARTGRPRRSFRMLIVADGPAPNTFEEMELRSTVAHIVETTPIELSTIVVGRRHLDALDLPGLAAYRTTDSAALSEAVVSEITKEDVER